MKKILVLLFLLITASFALELPPQRPENPVPFERPETGARSLDDNWVYAQTIFDALEGYPQYFGTYPVAVEFTHGGRGFLATLHTVFRTSNAGMTWQNIDPLPAPNYSPDYIDVRSPNYISDLAIRPIMRTGIQHDSVFISVYDADFESGIVRTIINVGGLYFLTDSLLRIEHWLTNIAAPDSQTVIALAGLDGEIFRTDSVTRLFPGDTVGIGTWDQLDYDFSDSWISDAISIGDTIICAGATTWRSEDNGETWNQFPAADNVHDNSMHFAPDRLHGLACGYSNSGQPRGWIRYTTDGGVTWSDRTWTSVFPISAVCMVTESLGFAVGGDYELGAGQIFRTTDGGQTWTVDLETNADMRVLSVARLSPAYVHVVAAGVYPDFSGGVWYSRVFLPDTTLAVLVADPDTLDFGAIQAGTRDTMSVTMQNIGTQSIDLITVSSNNLAFQSLCCAQTTTLDPQESITTDVIFRPDTAGTYMAQLTALNSAQNFVPIICTGIAGISAIEPNDVLIPSKPELEIYPNPGNAEFQIRFELSGTEDALVTIHDITGRQTATLIHERLNAGDHALSWNASEYASGIYFVRLETGRNTVLKKLVMVK